MNLTTHPVAPEEIMAWLDSELPSAEARTIAAHVEDCVECASLAEQFRAVAEIGFRQFRSVDSAREFGLRSVGPLIVGRRSRG